METNTVQSFPDLPLYAADHVAGFVKKMALLAILIGALLSCYFLGRIAVMEQLADGQRNAAVADRAQAAEELKKATDLYLRMKTAADEIEKLQSRKQSRQGTHADQMPSV